MRDWLTGAVRLRNRKPPYLIRIRRRHHVISKYRSSLLASSNPTNQATTLVPEHRLFQFKVKWNVFIFRCCCRKVSSLKMKLLFLLL